MKSLILLLLLVWSAYGQPTLKAKEIPQEQENCKHTKTKDFYGQIRFWPPSSITMIDGRFFTVVTYTENLIEHKEFKIFLKTRMPKDVWKIDLKKQYLIAYCEAHSTAYIVEQIPIK